MHIGSGENPRGVGILEGRVQGARWGTRGVSLQATWDSGGRFLSQLGGFQVSRKGYKREINKGSAPYIVYIATRVRVYIGMIELMKDTSCV
jgi:hypothetical protein